MAGRKGRSISAEDFDRLAENGDDLAPYLDLATTVQRVNVDFPTWVVEFLDSESKRHGITRQALIKTWIVQRIDSMTARKPA